MSLNKLERLVVAALEDLKGRDIKTLNVSKLCDFTDIMVFCSGTSNRHVKSLANNVIDAVKKQDFHPIGIEGKEEGEWVLVDLGDIVIHVMLPKTRELYQLEQLWGMQPE